MNIKQWMVGTVAFALVAGANGAFAATASLYNTGDDVSLSQNNSNVTRVNVSNSNTANINQTANVRANTGGNSANRNIGGGSVISGDAWFGANFDARANSNATSVSVPGGYGAAPLFTDVVNTGDNVRVRSNSSNLTNVNVDNNNNAWINQAADFNARTGGNSADRNIGGGSVYSGSAGFNAGFNAAANRNDTAVSVGGGSDYWPSGVSTLGLVNTGDDVNARTSVSNRTLTSVRNYNSLYENQTFRSYTSTGRNSADRDIFGGGILSGNVGGSATFNSAANSNATMVGVGSLGSLWTGGWNGMW